MELRFTQSARRHRIGKAHVLYVVSTYEATPTVTKRGEDGWDWVGNDDRGVELHVIGVPKPGDLLLIIHAFPTALNRRK